MGVFVEMAETCKVLGEFILRILQHIKESQSTELVVKDALEKLEEVAVLGDDISLSLLGNKVTFPIVIVSGSYFGNCRLRT